nr:hypothetical protein [Desulfuromonas sp.]
MSWLRTVVPLMVVLLAALALPAAGSGGMAPDPMTCLECHDDTASEHDFAASVHGRNACTSCHVEVVDIDAHTEGEIEVQPVNCVRCHKEEGHEYGGSVHADGEVGCTGCHSEIHSQKAWAGDKQDVVAKCQECHDVEGYEN